jgi:hypothetical protein
MQLAKYQTPLLISYSAISVSFALYRSYYDGVKYLNGINKQSSYECKHMIIKNSIQYDMNIFLGAVWPLYFIGSGVCFFIDMCKNLFVRFIMKNNYSLNDNKENKENKDD